MKSEEYKTEWCLLQNQFDSYEKHSLYIKLVSILALVATVISDAAGVSVVLILLVLWLQDAIWKTFQSRIEMRLLQLEKSIMEENSGDAFQFNSHFQSIRPGGLSLIGEYLNQSIRPTVAFPHIALIVISLVINMVQFNQ
ncbi:MAG: hypothetical protein OQJ89_03000 [Kangiellaceae bacterium]|nr:hypothetical protein [Kangiellaceae bacterium]MCW8997309.1 hypothetical protein [Kangiellaceae bacterium]MCW9015914.1 hypothetical protein [Kangiellaceae bacterium]